ncbi:MAG TPA: ABC transporter permease [Terracidiphilus sp.]|nr:ABC transporter permease [Terracidiphilus sp.]
MLSDLKYRLRALFRREQVDTELDEELRDHLECQTEKYIRSGIAPQEARRRARIALGGAEQIRQQCREARGTRLVENSLQDLRYCIRSLSRNRVFTIVFILTLALGIGSCTAIFSLMTAVLFPPLPYGDVGRLVYLTTPNRDIPQVPPEAFVPSNADFADLKHDSHSFSSMTQFEQQRIKLNGTAVSVGGVKVDGDFFTTLQVQPELGRGITAEDNQPNNDGVVVISYSLWPQLFAASRAVLGKPLQLDGKAYRIIGVMGPGFNFPHKTEVDYGDSHIDATDVWIPLALTAKERADRGLGGDAYVLGRLRKDISVKQAEGELNTIMTRLDPLHDSSTFTQGWYAYIKSMQSTMEGSARPLMNLLMGSVLFVLLIACANAANLLLARSSNRTHELGVRATLGAGRHRLLRQMLTESLLLGMGGGISGIALAWVFLRMLLRLDPGNIPRLSEATLNMRVLIFTFALTLLTSVAAGILPALASSRVNLVEFLKSGGNTGAVGSRNRLRSVLIVGEVAIVVVLLAGAGLLLRSYIKLEQVPTGFSSTTLSMRVDPPASYTSKPAQNHAFFRTLLEQIGSIPGVEAAGAVNNLPFGLEKGVGSFWVEGYPNQNGQMVDGASVTSGYFSAMNMPMIEGRPFTEADETGSPNVVIINQAFAKRYFAGRDPIGKWILPNRPQTAEPPTKNVRIVVGVVADVHDWSMETPPQPQLYSPMTDSGSTYIVIRSVLRPKQVADSASAILHRIDSGVAFTNVHTMQELVSESTARRRFQTVLLAIFAAMALVLALVGFYGLLAYAVRQRTSEMGIRIALGASKGHVIALVLRQGFRLVASGLIFGLLAALALTRLLSSSLYDVSALDPLTFAAVPALLLLATFLACLIPARHAASADPMSILRAE